MHTKAVVIRAEPPPAVVAAKNETDWPNVRHTPLGLFLPGPRVESLYAEQIIYSRQASGGENIRRRADVFAQHFLAAGIEVVNIRDRQIRQAVAPGQCAAAITRRKQTTPFAGVKPARVIAPFGMQHVSA